MVLYFRSCIKFVLISYRLFFSLVKFEKQKFSSSDKAVKDCKLSYQFVVRSFIAYISVFSYRKLNPHITVLNINFLFSLKFWLNLYNSLIPVRNVDLNMILKKRTI